MTNLGAKVYYKWFQKVSLAPRVPTVKLRIPGKLFLKVGSRTSVTFKLYLLTLAIYQWQRFGSPQPWKNVKNRKDVNIKIEKT